jgi:hypothetical protein
MSSQALPASRPLSPNPLITVADDDEPEYDDEGSNTSGDVRNNKRSVSPGDDGDPRSKKKRRESQAYTLADTIRRIKD